MSTRPGQAQIAQLDAPDSMTIGCAFHANGAILRSGLLVAADGAWLPTSAPFRPVPELLQVLLDEHDLQRLPLGITLVALPPTIILDATQRDALDLLRSASSGADILIVIHGPEGSGRRSAVAQVTDRVVLALDCARLEASTNSFDQALLALFREASLSDAVAVIVAPEDLVRPHNARSRTGSSNRRCRRSSSRRTMRSRSSRRGRR